MADEGLLPRFQPRRRLGRTGFQVTRVGIGDLAPMSFADVRRRAALAMEGKGEVWWNPR